MSEDHDLPLARKVGLLHAEQSPRPEIRKIAEGRLCAGCLGVPTGTTLRE